MNRSIFFLFLYISLPLLANERTFLPKRTIEEIPDGIIVTYFFEKSELVESNIYENTKYIRYDGFGINTNDGEPCVPFRKDTYIVPNNSNVTISVLDSAYNDTTIVLSPSLPIFSDSSSRILKHSIIPYEGFFPTSIVQSNGIFQYRDDNLISVSIFPVKYNLQTNTVRKYSFIKYKLSYTGVNHMRKGYGTSLARISCQNALAINNGQDIPDVDDKHYLIITTREYRDFLEDYIKWKRLKGYNVHVSTQDKGNWTVQAVTDSVRAYYTAYAIDFLLIVGDIDDVPAKTMYSFGNQGITDYQYGLPVNNIPQIRRGRIPVNNGEELEFILNKIIKYEKQPIMDESFYNTALHLGYYQDGEDSGEVIDSCEDRAFTLCAEELRNYMMTNPGKNIIRGYTHSLGTIPTRWNNDRYSYGDTISPDLRIGGNYNWGFNAQSIKDAIDAGTFYVFYRGHGQEEVWNSPGFPGWRPSTGTIGLPLENGNKYPFVFSIACLTGKFNHNNGNCLAETFLKNQSINGGCVGVIAATQESPSGPNDAFAYGMFDAIWPGFVPLYGLRNYNIYTSFTTPTYKVGEIMDLGLIRMDETWGPKTTMWELYHCFGDPSMMLYTEVPLPLQTPIIQIRNDTLYVNAPDEECWINIVNNSTNEVCSYYGSNAIQYIGNDDVSVCVDKHNHIPRVWHKSVNIQNENIIDSTIEYHADHVKVGRQVTNQKPQGNVTITNSSVTIKSNHLLLDSGTRLNVGSTLKVEILQ